jgi:hypothetical protein
LALAGCGFDQSTSRSDKPLSRQQATNAINVPFPLSARDIYYVIHSGGLQEFEMYVRFTVDSNELEGAVSNILWDHDRMIRTPSAGYLALPIAKSPPSEAQTQFQPMPWWNPESITNGYYRACTNGQPFGVRADLSTHMIYIEASD